MECPKCGIAEHREYDSFGAIDAVYSSLGGVRPTSLRFSEVAHAGRLWDDQADLYFNHARWYDPHAGRFVGEDPIYPADGPNPFEYAGNDPINFRDPTGLSQAGNPLNGLFNSTLGGSVLLNPQYRAPASNYSRDLASPQNSLVFRQSPSDPNLFLGPTLPAAKPLTERQKFDAYANELRTTVIARSFAETNALLNSRVTPNRGVALDQFVDEAFATIGNASRSLGNGLADRIESATIGYGGTFGTVLAGTGGALGQLSRTAGNVGAALDLPRTVQATVADVNEAIRIGSEGGFRLGVGHLIGTNQIAQYYVGNDFNGQEVDVNTLSDGILKLSGTLGTGASAARLVQPKLLASTSASRLAQANSELTILNPNFTPSGTRVLQNLTTQESALLRANLSRATEVLTREEQIAASIHPGIAKAQYGNAVEKLVAREINRDPTGLGSLFEHNRGVGPDFFGRGHLQGQIYDITTPGQVPAHLARPYGQGLNTIIYRRPAGFP